MNRTIVSNRRRMCLWLTAIATLLAAGVVVIVVGNDYRIDEKRVSIPSATGSLDAVLAVPRDQPARGLIVMIHGDGPIDATHEGLYRPWFEAAADAGFATLSWSKPGVGGSSGNWLDQSMDDRAAEAASAIDWAHSQPDVPRGPVMLWGASQAGWVLPKVAAARDDIDAIVGVGPAINWLRQGRFHLLAKLDDDHATAEERDRAIAVSDQTRQLLAGYAGYDAYRAATDDPEPMTAERWEFVKRNYRSDATADLLAIRDKRIPVLLMLGDHDRNVDTAETAATYRQVLGDGVTVERFNAAHSMAKPAMERSPSLGWATAIFWPRALFADGVRATYRTYLEARHASP